MNLLNHQCWFSAFALCAGLQIPSFASEHGRQSRRGFSLVFWVPVHWWSRQ